MRIDKIRKKNTSNIVDLDILRFDIKFDEYNYPIEDKCWFFKTIETNANINILKCPV